MRKMTQLQFVTLLRRMAKEREQSTVGQSVRYAAGVRAGATVAINSVADWLSTDIEIVNEGDRQ